MNQIGNQEQARRVCRKAGLHMRVQLKQGVEDEELNTRPLEYLFARDPLKYFFHRTLCSFVAVTDRILAELSFRIDHRAHPFKQSPQTLDARLDALRLCVADMRWHDTLLSDRWRRRCVPAPLPELERRPW